MRLLEEWMRGFGWITVLFGALACSVGDAPTEARFAELGEGEVRDSRSGLVWTARDSGRELSWSAADRHCRELGTRPGGVVWRLPAIVELAALYDTSTEQPCTATTSCRVDRAIQLSSPYQWSATAPQPDRRAYYDFALGSQLSPLIRPSLTRRALCTHAKRPRERSVPRRLPGS